MEATSTEDPALGVKIFAIFLVFVCTIVGTIPPFILRTAQLEMNEKRQRWFSWMNCLGGGIFLGFGFLHILPEAVQDFKIDTNGFPLIYFLALCGFMLILLVEKFFTWLSERAGGTPKFEKVDDSEELQDLSTLGDMEAGGDKDAQAVVMISDDEDDHDHDHEVRTTELSVNSDDDAPPKRKVAPHQHSASHHGHSHGLPLNIDSPFLPYILTIGLSFHSFFEGMALALTGRLITAIVILIGLAVHKSAETFAIGVKLVNTSISSRKWVWLMLTYSAITPFGIIVGILIESSVSAGALENVSSVLQSITVGTFLYVGVLGTVVEEFSTHKGIVPKACLFFFGLLAMGLLSMLDPPPSAPA
jgi:zinc transporter 1/2/3